MRKLFAIPLAFAVALAFTPGALAQKGEKEKSSKSDTKKKEKAEKGSKKDKEKSSKKKEKSKG